MQLGQRVLVPRRLRLPRQGNLIGKEIGDISARPFAPRGIFSQLGRPQRNFDMGLWQIDQDWIRGCGPAGYEYHRPPWAGRSPLGDAVLIPAGGRCSKKGGARFGGPTFRAVAEGRLGTRRLVQNRPPGGGPGSSFVVRSDGVPASRGRGAWRAEGSSSPRLK